MNKDTKVAKVAKTEIREERTHGRRAVARKEGNGQEKNWQRRKQSMLDVR